MTIYVERALLGTEDHNYNPGSHISTLNSPHLRKLLDGTLVRLPRHHSLP